MTSVLFVCLGNICRSPTAEAVFTKKAKDEGLNLSIDSAGTAGYHIGASPDPRSEHAAAKRGYDLSQLVSRQVDEQDFVDFDYILAMDKANLLDLQSLCPSEHQHKISLFLSHGQSSHDEVPDPYYGGDKGFEFVLDLVEDASVGLIQTIRKSTE